MNRNQLAEAIAEKTGLSAKDSSAALAAALDTVAAEVARGETVTLSGFGTFERRHRAARTGRNPQTGAALDIAASDAPAFKAAAAFKKQVNGS